MEPDFQYRTTPSALPDPAPQYTQDDADEPTIRAVYKDLKSQIDELNKWSAFDLEKDSPFTVEQQIEINRKVFELVQPAVDSLERALMLTDEKFRNRGK